MEMQRKRKDKAMRTNGEEKAEQTEPAGQTEPAEQIEPAGQEENQGENAQGRTPGRQRNLNADLIRCVAVFSVLSVHFLLNGGFYGVPVSGWQMLAMCMYRSFFMTCVPLFMMLTGFLMWRKKLSRGYYKGLWKTIEIYLLASIACLLFKKFVQEEPITFYSGLLSILAFKGANYSWYIEMYIGLFLIIPFLNLAYHGLENKRQKKCLVLTMVLLTMVPKMVNNFNLTDLQWWLSPAGSDEYNKLVPSFFTAMYPITYYFIGVYLREYGWKISRKKNVLLLLLAVAGFGAYNYYRSGGGTFIWGSNSTWGGENLITAVLWFTLLLHMRPQRWPNVVQRALVYISKVSLGIYLISWIFDKIVYQVWLIPYVPVREDRFLFFPVVVGAVFLGSLGGASLLYFVRNLVRKLLFRQDFEV